jgi:uncharacterized membrane protein YdbT with pleckstrin-like domain
VIGFSPMAENLAAGEQIIFEGHPSWRSILAFYFKGLLIAIVAGIIAKLVQGNSATYIVVLVILALTVLVGFIKRVATTYRITDRRLNIKRGIISREVQETRLERVQNVNYNQGILERILQIGDVDFDTAGSGDYDFVFAGVAQPEEVVKKVDRAVAVHAAGPQGLGTPQAGPATPQVPPQQPPPAQQPPPQHPPPQQPPQQ